MTPTPATPERDVETRLPFTQHEHDAFATVCFTAMRTHEVFQPARMRLSFDDLRKMSRELANVMLRWSAEREPRKETARNIALSDALREAKAKIAGLEADRNDWMNGSVSLTQQVTSLRAELDGLRNGVVNDEAVERGYLAAIAFLESPPRALSEDADGEDLYDEMHKAVRIALAAALQGDTPMIIHNGDHAEFERDHANVAPKDRPDWPLPSFDAKDWAEAFVKLHGGDEGLMLAWFANALMRGYDERQAPPEDLNQKAMHGQCGEHGEPYATLEIFRREDGGFRLRSPDVIGLIKSGPTLAWCLGDLAEIIPDLIAANGRLPKSSERPISRDSVRSEALEEAAKACDEIANCYHADAKHYKEYSEFKAADASRQKASSAMKCADAIRALSQPQASETTGPKLEGEG